MNYIQDILKKDGHTKAGIKLEFIISSRFHVLITKLTRKTAKNSATKSIEKGVSTAIENVGEKVTQKLVKKWSQKPAEENKRKLFSELLRSHPGNIKYQTDKPEKYYSLRQEFQQSFNTVFEYCLIHTSTTLSMWRI